MTSAIGARLDPEKLIEQASELAGSDDFVTEADLSPAGRRDRRRRRDSAAAQPPADHRMAQGPSGRRAEGIERPIVILGQPRTGMTILYDLLAQDHDLRAPLTWEVDHPCPPAQPDTYDTDPRIAETQAQLEMSEQLMPGFMKFHPMSARGGQECVRMFAGTFCSMIFTVQYRLPDYHHWLMHEAVHSVAYHYHRKYLQHLESGVPGGGS